MIPVDGTVVECMGNTTFKVKIAEGHEVLFSPNPRTPLNGLPIEWELVR